MGQTDLLSLPALAGALGQGDPNEHITGTKTSGPRGIESVIEYNGLLMNVRSWVDTYIIKSINGLDDADVRDSREVNPTRHGETPFNSLYGGRTLVLNGKIETKTIWKLRDMEQALRQAFVDISKEMPLIFRSGNVATDMFIMCKKNSGITWADEQTTDNGFQREFQITLRASEPAFLGYTEVVKDNTLPFTGGDTHLYFDAHNSGNFEAMPIIRVYGPMVAAASNGYMMTIANDANDNVIILKAPRSSSTVIPAGNYLEIDILHCMLREKAANGDLVSDRRFDRLDGSSDWLQLEAGANPIEITMRSGYSGSPHVQFRYRNTVM